MTMYPDDHAPWWRNRKNPPLVQGGQGRDAADIHSSAATIAAILLLAALCASVAFVVWGTA